MRVSSQPTHHTLSPPSDSTGSQLDDLFAEISARLSAGDSVTCEDYCDKYPACADQIRAAWPALQTFAMIGAGVDANDGLAGYDVEQQVVGDYRILRELGRGGMGIVYEAEQLSLGRRVALKVLPSASLLDQRLLQRFQNEAHAAAALQHRNIVKVHAVGVEHGIHFFSMELIHGQSFAELIERCRLEETTTPGTRPASDHAKETNRLAGISTRSSGSRQKRYQNIARLIAEVADALEYAHQEGIVHRDVKPSNLLLDEQGHVFVADFGLAQIANDAALTITGDVLGTLRYMSPEQLDGKRLIDGRTDVYSLGLVLYELMTLRPAYPSADRHRLLREISDARPVAPRQVDSAIPRDLETISLKATARDPSARYASAGDFAEDLRRFASQQPIQARRVGRLTHLVLWAQRNQGLAAATGLLVILLVALAVGGPVAAVRQQRITQAAEDRLYAHSIRAAYDAWQAGDHFIAVEHLKPYVDTEKSERFEFQHLWNHLHQHVSEQRSTLVHPNTLIRLASSPDGRSLATATVDGFIRTWDTSSQSMIGMTNVGRDGSGFAHWVAFTPDGQYVVWAHWSGTIGLLRANDLSEVDVIQLGDNRGITRALALSPDGTRVAVITKHNAIVLVNITTEKLTVDRSLPVRTQYHGCDLDFSPDGKRLVFSDILGNVGVWDLETCTEHAHLLVSFPSDVFLPVRFSPDGQTLAVGSREITFWSTESWQITGRVNAGDTLIFDAAYSRDGRYFAFGQRNVARIVDVDTLQVVKTLSTSTGTISLAFCGNQSHTLASIGSKGDLRCAQLNEIEARPPPRTARVSDHWYLPSIKLHRKNNRLTFRAENYSLQGNPIDFYVVSAHIDDLNSEPKAYHNARCTSEVVNNFASVTAYYDGIQSHLVYSSNATGRKSTSVPIAEYPITWMELAANDHRVAGMYQTEDSTVVFSWSPQDSELRTLLNHPDIEGTRVKKPNISPSGRYVACAASGWNKGTIYVTNLDDSEAGFELRGKPYFDGPLSVAFSSDERYLVAGYHSGTVVFWDLESRTPARTLTTWKGPIWSIAVAGDLLALGQVNAGVSLFDMNVGHRLAELRTPDIPVSLAVSPDHSALAAACLDGSIKIWEDSGPVHQWTGDSIREVVDRTTNLTMPR